MKLVIIILTSCLIGTLPHDLYAAGSIVDDHMQDSSTVYETMSMQQAMTKYESCLGSPSEDLCKTYVCNFEFCKNKNRWADVQNGWCTSEMQALIQCRKNTAEARVERAQAKQARQKQCDEINERFLKEYKKNNLSVCRQLANNNSDCRWHEEGTRLIKCRELNDQFDAAVKNQNIPRVKKLKETGDYYKCDWVSQAEWFLHEVDCKEKGGQFEKYFKDGNLSQCHTILSRSTTCSWSHDAEARLLARPSMGSYEAPPPTPLSECLSMEAAYNEALRKGNSAACAMWLDNAAGCSWRDKIVRQNEINPPPTIGPQDSSPGSDEEETNPPGTDFPFSTSGGHYNDPDDEPGAPSPFSTTGGHYNGGGDIAETPPPSLPDQPDCKALEGNFNFAMTSGDIGWAQSVLADSGSCSFHSVGQAMVCQILQGSFQNALKQENWSSAQVALVQGKSCRFASNGAGQIESAQMTAECTKLKQKFNGLMAQGQSLQARNTLNTAYKLGCTIPNADIQTLNQKLKELKQKHQQRVQQREDQQQALFNVVMGGMATIAEMNQQKETPSSSGGNNNKETSGTRKKVKHCQGHTFICAKNKKREGLALDVDDDGVCDICGGVVHIDRGGWCHSTSDATCREVK